MADGRKIRVGTRGSPLALVQANWVRDRLAETHAIPADGIEIHVIKTSGDAIQDRPLAEVGGKGLFTKEIEDALQAGTIDLAVHSMKDVATRLPDDLEICVVLEREDVRDAFISTRHATLTDLPSGAILGTSSLRRQAQILRLRPDLQIVGFRGNVETRLRKLADGVADATLLALAGIKRLGLHNRATHILDIDTLLPAVAQGAVGIEIRKGDTHTADLVRPLDHAETSAAVRAERAFLAGLDGSCRTPIAGHARIIGHQVHLTGEVLTPDGRFHLRTTRVGPSADGEKLGADAAREIRAKAGNRFAWMTP
jgi:hydroxymethylbilane synthase